MCVVCELLFEMCRIAPFFNDKPPSYWQARLECVDYIIFIDPGWRFIYTKLVLTPAQLKRWGLNATGREEFVHFLSDGEYRKLLQKDRTQTLSCAKASGTKGNIYREREPFDS